MPFNEIEKRRYEKITEEFIKKRRPPVEIRNQVDLSFSFSGNSIEIFEIRPQWNDPAVIMHIPIVKTTYQNTAKVWKIYWQRSDLKWHGYEPCPQVDSLEKFFQIVEQDEYACFWG